MFHPASKNNFILIMSFHFLPDEVNVIFLMLFHQGNIKRFLKGKSLQDH
jgi:hypothetical protein